MVPSDFRSLAPNRAQNGSLGLNGLRDFSELPFADCCRLDAAVGDGPGSRDIMCVTIGKTSVWQRVLTSSLVAARAVLPASRRLPARPPHGRFQISAVQGALPFGRGLPAGLLVLAGAAKAACGVMSPSVLLPSPTTTNGIRRGVWPRGASRRQSATAWRDERPPSGRSSAPASARQTCGWSAWSRRRN